MEILFICPYIVFEFKTDVGKERQCISNLSTIDNEQPEEFNNQTIVEIYEIEWKSMEMPENLKKYWKHLEI